MPWFMVDDAINADEKIAQLAPGIDRAEAMGTWVICGAWSSLKLKDGAVPKVMVTALGATERGAELLVEVKLWKRARGGYQFINWPKYQRTKAQVVAKREDEAERKRKYRESKAQANGGNVQGVSQRDKSGVPHVSASPIPAHPSPSQPLSNSPSEGKSPKQRASEPPQPCGRVHDPAKPCRACAVAAKEAEAEALRVKAEKARAKSAADKAARDAETAATLAEIDTDPAATKAAAQKALAAVKAELAKEESA